jgi:hypothetical protein
MKSVYNTNSCVLIVTDDAIFFGKNIHIKEGDRCGHYRFNFTRETNGRINDDSELLEIDSHGVVQSKVGIGNPFPLFFFISKNILIIGRSIDLVIKARDKMTSASTAWDMPAILASLRLDFVPGRNTYVANIQKTIMGEIYTWDANRGTVRVNVWWRPRFAQNGRVPPRTSTDEAAEMFAHIENNIRLDKKTVVPLSGGLDSRVIACLFRTRSPSVETSFTYARGPSLESWIAQLVARKLAIKHVSIQLPEEVYDAWGDDWTRKTYGLVTPLHCHMLYCMKFLVRSGIQDSIAHIGYFADPITGAMQQDKGVGITTGQPDLLLANYLTKSEIEAGGDYVEFLSEEIQKEWTIFSTFNDDHSRFYEYWKIVQRQNGLITHIFDAIREYAEVCYPYLSQIFIDWYLSLDREDRTGRKLFIEAANKRWPDIFKIISTDFSGSRVKKIYQMISKATNLSQYLADGLYPGQNIVKSPFLFEQHRRLILYELQEKVKSALDLLCDHRPNTNNSGVPVQPNWQNAGRLLAIKAILTGG